MSFGTSAYCFMGYTVESKDGRKEVRADEYKSDL